MVGEEKEAKVITKLRTWLGKRLAFEAFRDLNDIALARENQINALDQRLDVLDRDHSQLQAKYAEDIRLMNKEMLRLKTENSSLDASFKKYPPEPWHMARFNAAKQIHEAEVFGLQKQIHGLKRQLDRLLHNDG